MFLAVASWPIELEIAASLSLASFVIALVIALFLSSISLEIEADNLVSSLVARVVSSVINLLRFSLAVSKFEFVVAIEFFSSASTPVALETSAVKSAAILDSSAFALVDSALTAFLMSLKTMMAMVFLMQKNSKACLKRRSLKE